MAQVSGDSSVSEARVCRVGLSAPIFALSNARITLIVQFIHSHDIWQGVTGVWHESSLFKHLCMIILVRRLNRIQEVGVFNGDIVWIKT